MGLQVQWLEKKTSCCARGPLWFHLSLWCSGGHCLQVRERRNKPKRVVSFLDKVQIQEALQSIFDELPQMGFGIQKGRAWKRESLLDVLHMMKNPKVFKGLVLWACGYAVNHDFTSYQSLICIQCKQSDSSSCHTWYPYFFLRMLSGGECL